MHPPNNCGHQTLTALLLIKEATHWSHRVLQNILAYNSSLTNNFRVTTFFFDGGGVGNGWYILENLCLPFFWNACVHNSQVYVESPAYV